MLQDPTNTRIGASSIAPGWRTNPTLQVVAPTATLALVSAPSAGEVDAASEAFVVSINGTLTGDVVVTPYIYSAPVGGSGVFTPSTATVNVVSAPYDTWTFTPDTVGAYQIGVTNDRGLTNPTPADYSAESPYVAPDLSEEWVTDMHPKRALNVSQGTIPAGAVSHAGENNGINCQSEYSTDSVVQTFPLGASITEGDGDALDADSLTRLGAYETLRIITDPDNASRSAYEMRWDTVVGGWTPTGTTHKKLRIQLSATGNARKTRPWGEHTWLVMAHRLPASMKSLPPEAGSYGWNTLFDLHTTVADFTASHLALRFNGGGPSNPTAAQIYLRVDHWNESTGQEDTNNLLLFAGGANDAVPADTWIYTLIEHRLWHGYDDPSTVPVATPTGDFFVRPYIAIGSGPPIQKPSHEGVWGIPYAANSSGWARPQYPILALYSNPLASAITERNVLTLGMQEYIVSDLPAGMTAQDILTAFKASRLITP